MLVFFFFLFYFISVLFSFPGSTALAFRAAAAAGGGGHLFPHLFPLLCTQPPRPEKGGWARSSEARPGGSGARGPRRSPNPSVPSPENHGTENHCGGPGDATTCEPIGRRSRGGPRAPLRAPRPAPRPGWARGPRPRLSPAGRLSPAASLGPWPGLRRALRPASKDPDHDLRGCRYLTALPALKFPAAICKFLPAGRKSPGH